MKKFSALFAVLCLAFGLSAQSLTNLAYFPFTDNEASPNTPTSYTAEYGEQAGSAGLYLDGTHGSSAWAAATELTSNNGSTINLQYDEVSSKDLATINNSANGKSIVFHFSTTGYQNVVMTMAARRSGQGFNSTVWAYSTDGTNFTTIPNASTVPSEATTYELQTLDFTSVSGINDQANVYLRCTYDGAQSASASFRIDNILIAAYPAGPDVWAPTVSSVETNGANTVNVTFNEPVTEATAENTANYTIDNGITISAAAMTNNTVALTTSELTEGSTYVLTVSNITDAAGNVMAPDTIEFTYGVSSEFQCATIAELRSKLDFSDNSSNVNDAVEYKVTGDVVITAVASYNNQKVIQDATGAILVYDPNGTLDPDGTLEVGDKINGLYGTLTNYYGFLEFKPTAAYEQKTAIYQEVEPMEITLEQLNDQSFMIQHQSELIKLSNVTFNDNGQFATLSTYSITQNGVTATAVFPYFQDANYIGTDIPSGTLNLIGTNFATGKIGNNYPDFRYYIVPRTLNDFTTGIRNYEQTVSVYPNPATDLVTFQLDTPIDNVMIYDINGKLVANESVTANHIRVSALNSGIYFVKMYQQNEMIGVAKIVKY